MEHRCSIKDEARLAKERVKIKAARRVALAALVDKTPEFVFVMLLFCCLEAFIRAQISSVSILGFNVACSDVS